MTKTGMQPCVYVCDCVSDSHPIMPQHHGIHDVYNSLRMNQACALTRNEHSNLMYFQPSCTNFSQATKPHFGAGFVLDSKQDVLARIGVVLTTFVQGCSIDMDALN